MVSLDDGLVAARVRAVLAYAALNYDDVAERTGLGAATLRRMCSPTNPRGAALHELAQIANACHVPLRWLTRDWEEPDVAGPPLLGAGGTEERLRTIEHYLGALLMLEEARTGEAVPPLPGGRVPPGLPEPGPPEPPANAEGNPRRKRRRAAGAPGAGGRS